MPFNRGRVRQGSRVSMRRLYDLRFLSCAGYITADSPVWGLRKALEMEKTYINARSWANVLA